MRIRYLQSAARDLNELITYVARDNPLAASSLERECRVFLELLADFPHAGRRSGFSGVRYSPVPRLPYVIYYRLLPGELRILRIRHARRRPLGHS